MVSKKAKAMLAEIFHAQKIGKNAEAYLIELLRQIIVRRNHDEDFSLGVRLMGELIAEGIRETTRSKRLLAKTQPKKPPRAKKKPGIRVTIEQWNPTFRGRDPKYFLVVQVGELSLRPDRKVGNSQGIFHLDECVILAKRAAEILGVTAEIPAKLE